MNLTDIIKTLKKYDKLSYDFEPSVLSFMEKNNLKNAISLLQDVSEIGHCKCEMPAYKIPHYYHCAKCNKLLPDIVIDKT